MKLEKELRVKLLPLLDELPPDRWEALQVEWRRRQLCVVEPLSARRKRRFPRLLLCTVAAMTACGVLLCTPVGGAWLVGRQFAPAASHLTGESVASDIVIVNEVVEKHSDPHNAAPSDIQHIKELTFSELLDYLEYDIRPTKLPRDLWFRSDIMKNNPPNLQYDFDGCLIYSRNTNFYFLYTSRISSARRIVINFSKISNQLGDKKYSFEKENTVAGQSIINGLDVKIGCLSAVEVIDGYENKMPTERYVAEFTVKGVHLQVTADNLTQEEFITVVKSMIR